MAALYLDTSCFLKLFFLEPETASVLEALAREEHVVFSSPPRSQQPAWVD